MRDLHTRTTPVNGAERVTLADDPVSMTEMTAEDLAHHVREAKRDRALADIAVMLWDTAKAVEPIVEMISARLLRWAALGVSAALAFQAMRVAAEWERLAVVAAFMLLTPVVIRFGK